MPTQLKLDQVQFPAAQVASADPNCLDDYEEGTFTPSIILGTSGSVTLGGAAVRYTKIGRVVHVCGLVQLTAMSSPSGSVSIGGLPFASAIFTPATILATLLNGATNTTVYGNINLGASVIGLYKPAAGSVTPLLGSDLGSTTELYFSATYTV